MNAQIAQAEIVEIGKSECDAHLDLIRVLVHRIDLGTEVTRRLFHQRKDFGIEYL